MATSVVAAILVIDATSSSQSPSISFTWTTMDGVFNSGEQTLTPTIAAPGSYELTLFDSSNDCEKISAASMRLLSLF